MGKLDGKIAIITGSGSGIGRAIAILFAQEGAKIVVADIADEQGKETVRMIKERGGDAIFVHTDVSKEEDVKNMVKTAVNTYGRLHIVVNNAGIGGTIADSANYPESSFDNVIAVNLRGVFLGIKYAIPELIKSGGGSIINMASIAGLLGFPGDSAYAATKGGVIQLTRTAALEYAKYNIRVNAIAPGWIETPLVLKYFSEHPEAKELAIKMTPLGRLGKPEEIAKIALFLASDDSSYITGAVIVADGGLSIQ